MPDALLSVKGLNAWYGESHVLHGVDLEVRRGELITLVGRNGAGKTTTLKSIMGMIIKRSGSVALEGQETIAFPSYRIARQGIAFCPEERGIFASLDVEENLLLPPRVREGGLNVKQVFELFPTCASACAARAPSSPAASSRCSPSGASCAPARACCCSASRPKALRR